MKHLNLQARRVVAAILVLQLSGMPVAAPLLAQPVFEQNNPFGPRAPIGSGVENLRVVEQNADGTEALLTMDYTYDGFAGPVAQLMPVIGKRGEKGISGWFGSDPVTIGRGRGTISIKVKYFNDEPGVPPMFTSDQVRIMILNQRGTATISAVPFLKTIKWGNASTKPAVSAPATPPSMTPDEAKKIAEEKRIAEEQARAEAELREQLKLKAEAEATARQKTERKARAEALARQEAQRLAEEESRRLARERRLAEEKARAEALAREEARAKAEAEARALTEAKAREELRAKAEAEAKRLAEERRIAEAKAKAEALAREEARLKAEADAKRLAEEKRIAEEKAMAETKARKEAEEKAWQEALAQAKAELAAKNLAEEKRQAEAIAQAPAPNATAPSMPLAANLKTKITNVDVVNRSIDRTQMTFGVEFEYRDRLSDPVVGVEVFRQGDPQVSRYFVSRPAEIGRSRRNFALLPVTFQPPSGNPEIASVTTDKVVVYLQEKEGAQRYNLFPATMLLMWGTPAVASAAAQNKNANSVAIDDFKQNDASNGYVTVKYHLAGGKGRLRAKVFDAKKPESAKYFQTQLRDVQAGRGLQLIDVSVSENSQSPTDVVPADTIEVELLDASGTVLATTTKEAAMVWSKPKEDR